jgi:hypothetical protein
LEKEEANNLIKSNSKLNAVIYPYINGDDINNDINCEPSRFVIYFKDWSLNESQMFPEVFSIVEEKVKPERLKKKSKDYRDKWWQFARRAKEISENISALKRFFIAPRTTKYILIVEGEPNVLFSDATIGFARESFSDFSVLQSELFDSWVRQYSSSLGNTIRMTPSDSTENFPFPKENTAQTNLVGETLYNKRKVINQLLDIGLTDLYNLFHTKLLSNSEIKKVSKKDESKCKIAYDDILKLRELHRQMDEAVLEAYGWSDIQLRHDFYEVEFLPENDRVRYTIHPDARKEVLKRLLELNHTIYEEEIKQGLHKEEDVKKFYEQKGIPVPAEVIAIMGVAKKEKKAKEYKSKSKKSTVNEGESVYKQPGLFEEDNLFSQPEDK